MAPRVEVGNEFDAALDSVPAHMVSTVLSLLDDRLSEIRDSCRFGDDEPLVVSDENRSRVNRWHIANDKRDRAREWREQKVAIRRAADA